MSSTISRVMSWVIIYLGLLLPTGSSDLPESTTGRRIALCSVLLRMGFTYALSVTRKAVSSYLTFPPLPQQRVAVYFCCTGLGVTSTGRYPASCPVKLGLSSPAPFRLDGRDHLCCSCFHPNRIPPPINSRKMEFSGTSCGSIGIK